MVLALLVNLPSDHADGEGGTLAGAVERSGLMAEVRRLRALFQNEVY